MNRRALTGNVVLTFIGASLVVVAGLIVGVWWMGMQASNAAADTQRTQVVDDLRSEWNSPTTVTATDLVADVMTGSVTADIPFPDTSATANTPTVTTSTVSDAAPAARPKAVALLTVKTAGVVDVPIVLGVDDAALAAGAGLDPATPRPGTDGQMSVIAGHRATHGEVFATLPDAQPGDTATIETKKEVLTYRLGKQWRINDGDLLTVPAPTSDSGILLVTCHPRWGHGERIIVPGELISRTAKG